MKQVLQVLGTGDVQVMEIPDPIVRPGGVLVRNQASVVSVGTDRMQIDFGRKSLLAKARERPEQVRQVLKSVARDGLKATRARVQRKLEGHVALGYSCAGIVEAVGDGADLQVGQRVACAGAGFASHAERVWVPKNLVVPIPDVVRFEEAAFSTMGAIALHGIRQAAPALGETVAVIGLGLLGQLTVQMLAAAGVRAIAIDVDAARVELAAAHGAQGLLRGDAVEAAIAVATGGIGVDAVLITAATSSDDPIRLSGRITRDRGRVVLVGAVPMNVPRSPFYEKEIDLRFSRSYGPGRYDREYEEKGHDYPVGHVRWTERRNLAEFLRLVANGQVRLDALITHRFPVERAADAYASVRSGGGPAPLGVVLTYPEQPQATPLRIELRASPARVSADRPGIGFIGAGSFASDMLLPILQSLPVDLAGVTTARGVTALDAAKHFGFRYTASDPEALLSDASVHAVFIATRHDEHAALAARALEAGKAVFVEKPLAIDARSLERVLESARTGPPLAVGFNRRFAPATQFLVDRLQRLPGARVIHIRVNAGAIPAESWMHDREVGGGRLIGEGCHFIDLAAYLAGSPIRDVSVAGLGGTDPAAKLFDNFTIALRFDDGSLANIVYTSKGSAQAGKERVEVFAAGATGIIDDFRTAQFHGQRTEQWKGKQDKGHAEQLRRFVAAVATGAAAPIPLADLAAVSRTTLLAAAALERPATTEPLEISV